MTERLADISARIDGIRQLGAVVNAMKGIAAARANMARAQLDAVDSHAAMIAAAMAHVTNAGDAGRGTSAHPDPDRTGLLVFCAEQGFAGAFSERVLDSLAGQIDRGCLFLVGTRGLSVAASRGIVPGWNGALPSHTSGIPKLADAITLAIFREVAEGRINRLDVVFTEWSAGRSAVQRMGLFPLDLADLPEVGGQSPLMQMSRQDVIQAFGQDYFHAQVCKAALHAFAAENEARMESMTAAGTQIDRERKTFEETLRRVRQEAITAEIIELGTGAVSAR